MATVLGGCVRYGVAVDFQSQTHGEMVQHIKLADRLTSFSRVTAEDWLKSIEKRAKKLHGKVKHLSDQEILVKIPFDNGKDLEKKFNQFFNPAKNQGALLGTEAGLPELSSQLTVKQNNLFFWIRNHLELDLDLTSLGVMSADGNVLISPGTLLELEFSLNTPLGAKSIPSDNENAITPERLENGHQLVWTLQPGQINHLEAVFWLPSPIGIGAVAIILFVALGMYLKSKQTPQPSLSVVGKPL